MQKNPKIYVVFVVLAIFLSILISTIKVKAVGFETVVIHEAGHTHFPRNTGNATLLQNGKVLISGTVSESEIYDPQNGTFTLSGSMIVRRDYSTATRLQDGRVLIVGGYGSDWLEPHRSAELYDPSTGTFSLTTSPPNVARYDHSATLLNDGRVLIAGGRGVMVNSQRSAEIFDPDTNSFTLLTDMTVPRANHSACLLPNGKVLITGGDSPPDVTSSAELFDPSTNTFSPLGNMSTTRTGHQSVLLKDGKVLLIGGNFEPYGEVTSELYNPTDEMFSNGGVITEIYDFNVSATLLPNGKVFVVAYPWATYLYDPLTLGFTRTHDTICQGSFRGTVLLESGKVLLVGGKYPLEMCLDQELALLATLVEDSQPPVGAIQINKGAISTTTRNVQVDVNAIDNVSVVNFMRFGVDGTHWDAWIPYSTKSFFTLPGGDGLKSIYAQFRDLPGNISSSTKAEIELNTSVPSSFGLSINNGALFTNQVHVTLKSGAAPFTSKMQISNDGGFAGTAWVPYDAVSTWQITQYGNYVIPRVVYIKYMDVDGNVSGVYQDDIILDEKPPKGSIRVLTDESTEIGENVTVITLELLATDDVSGVESMRISSSSSFIGEDWHNYVTQLVWRTSGEKLLYAQYKDYAGNVSDTYSTFIGGEVQIFIPMTIKK